jgi:hypothetical protein
MSTSNTLLSVKMKHPRNIRHRNGTCELRYGTPPNQEQERAEE